MWLSFIKFKQVIVLKSDIMYIELKTGYHDNGPAWIGKVKYSKTKQTIYFNNKAFKKGCSGYGNYTDIETGESYWISGVKKDGHDRHWAGSGKIMIDNIVVDEYLELTGQKALDEGKYTRVDIPCHYPVERIKEIENKKLDNND